MIKKNTNKKIFVRKSSGAVPIGDSQDPAAEGVGATTTTNNSKDDETEEEKQGEEEDLRPVRRSDAPGFSDDVIPSYLEEEEEEEIHTPLAEHIIPSLRGGGGPTSVVAGAPSFRSVDAFDDDEELLMEEENRYREYCHHRQEFLELYPIQEVEYRNGRFYGWAFGVFALPCVANCDHGEDSPTHAVSTGGYMGCAYHYGCLALVAFLFTVPLFFYEHKWRWISMGLDVFFLVLALIFYGVGVVSCKRYILEPPTPPDPSLYPKLSMRARTLTDVALRQAARSIRTKKQSQAPRYHHLADSSSHSSTGPLGGVLTHRHTLRSGWGSMTSGGGLDVNEFGSFMKTRGESSNRGGSTRPSSTSDVIFVEVPSTNDVV